MSSLVILPTYNERDNLPLVVTALLRIPQVNVLIVDDASPDGTGEVLEQWHDTATTVEYIAKTDRGKFCTGVAGSQPGNNRFGKAFGGTHHADRLHSFIR